MPNLDSPLWKMSESIPTGRRWSTSTSRASIHRLLESCGFSPVRYGISDIARMEIPRAEHGGGVPREAGVAARRDERYENATREGGVFDLLASPRGFEPRFIP
jgi:hypothetical protein